MLSAVLVAIAAYAYLPATFAELRAAGSTGVPTGNPRLVAIGAVVIGIVLAAAIQALTGYFTETNRRPVQDIGKSSQTGAATVILAGISVGLESAVYSALLIGAGVFGAFLLGGSSITLSLFAVALAGTGLLTTVGVIVAMDTFGPISDNAQGIAEMSGDIDEHGARIADRAGRGRQHHQGDHQGHRDRHRGAGRDRAVRLVHRHAAHRVRATPAWATSATEILNSLNVANPRNLVGLIIGAAVVFLFSGLAINAVSRSAGAVVMEVRRQFRELPGIMDRTQRPEYGKVVDICTRDAQRELMTPGLLAILAPDRGRLRPRAGRARVVPGRCDRRRHADGGLPGQLRWRLGQRQEAGRGRRVRRQGLRGARRDGHRRHRR